MATVKVLNRYAENIAGQELPGYCVLREQGAKVRACTRSLPLTSVRFPIGRRGHPQFLLETVTEIILIRITTLCADLF